MTDKQPTYAELKQCLAELQQQQQQQNESLRFQADVLAQISDAVVTMDAAQRITFFNHAAERMYGLTAQEVLGRKLTEFHRHIWPNRRDRQKVRLALAKEGVWQGESLHTTRDGEQLYVEAKVSVLKNEHGASVGTLAVICDISGRRRAEEKLRLRNERLTLLSEAAAHLLRAPDSRAMVRGLFEQASNHLNVQAYFNFTLNGNGEAIRLESLDGIPEEAARLIAQWELDQGVCSTAARTRQMVHATNVQTSGDPKMELIRRYGIRAYCCNPLMAGERLLGTLSFFSRVLDRFDEDDLEFMRTISHYVAIARERLRLEKELRERIKQLDEADQRKDEFLAMLAHELRNPLAAISSAIHLLQMGGMEGQSQQRARDAAQRQAGHMTRLLDDLLDVSRVTRGKVTLKKQEMVLSSAIDSAVEASNPLLKEKGHRLFLSIPREPLFLNADHVRLTQVFSNVLNNAVRYTPSGGEVYLSVETEENDAVIRVRDNGSGIEAQLLPHVFDLFVQSDRAPDRAQGGLGIGLTMVRSLVEMHGGRVEAHSEGAGKGSEFVIRLPLSRMKADIPKPESRQIEAIAPRRILVVDDNADAAEMLAALLQIDGHEVVTAHSGQAAIDLAIRWSPDVALVDIGMPVMDGFEVARRLRQQPALAHMVLVAITGYGQEEDLQKSRKAGFDHHLVKPVGMETLRPVFAAMTVPPAKGIPQRR